MSKLPLEVRLQIARVTTGDVWEVEELLRVLKQEVVARELSDTVRVNEKTTNSGKKAFPPTAAALMAGDHTSRRIRCAYCKEEHYSASCGLKPIKRETLNPNTFGDSIFKKKDCEVVNVTLQSSRDGDISVTTLVFPTICSPMSVRVDIDRYTHLQGLELADCLIASESNHDHSGDTIDVLIGSDYYWEFVTNEIIHGEKGPVAVNSKFGWLIFGPVKGIGSNDVITDLIIEGSSADVTSLDSDDLLTNSLKQFWETESIGIFNEEIAGPSVKGPFPPDIKFDWVQKRYKVGLPWKTCKPIFSNYNLCVSRLQHLKSHMKHNPVLLHQYDETFKTQVETQIIDRVPVGKLDKKEAHFLPHHGVVRADKVTTKLRIVFDGSEKSELFKYSLNDCLEKGPNLTILSSCVWADTNPAILNGVLQHHLASQQMVSPNVAKLLSESLYVDDFLGGAQDIEEGFNVYQGATEIMKAGGFNLRKWSTNKDALAQRISSGTTSTQDSIVKVLGINRDKQNDYFFFEFSELIKYVSTFPPTKRSLLKVSAKVFDPLGLLSSFSIRAKILFQKLCSFKKDWDETLEGEALRKCTHEFEELRHVKVPRCYFNPTQEVLRLELHGFSDASEKAYAAAVYLRTVYRDGNTVNTQLIAAKTRVAPIKKQSIPCLELLGATILARLLSSVQASLESTTTICQSYY